MAGYMHLDPHEVRTSYEFTVIKKLLMRQYPWIKRVDFSDEEINNYSLIFLDLYIDPWQTAKQEGWLVVHYVQNLMKILPEYSSPYLSLFFVEKEEPRELNSKIGNIIDNIRKSPALPEEFKLPSNRKFDTGTWIVDKSSIPLPQYTEKNSD